MHKDTIHQFYEDTLFIIVIYNCEILQSNTFQSLCKSTSSQRLKDIFIYDNSRLAQPLPFVNEKIYYHHNPDNAGVSAAYNKGFEKAKELNKKWLLLFDQDTHFDDGTLEKYAQSTLRYRDVYIFAPMMMKDNHQLLSPFRIIGGKGIRSKPRQPGIHFFRPLYVINSGLLIASRLFEAAGGYNELFPLDFSDVVFIKRLCVMDRRFVLVNATLAHSLSSERDLHNATNIVLVRFEKFCTAAKLFKKASNERVILSLILLPRAIKLTLMKKDIKFLLIAVHTLVSTR